MGFFRFGNKSENTDNRDIPDIAGIEIGILKARKQNFKNREARKNKIFIPWFRDFDLRDRWFFNLEIWLPVLGIFNLGILCPGIRDFISRDSGFRSQGFGISIPGIWDFDPGDSGFRTLGLGILLPRIRDLLIRWDFFYFCKNLKISTQIPENYLW